MRSVLSLRAFAIRRAQFQQYLAASSTLTIGRYFRLMAIATVELLCTTPIAAYGLYVNATSPIFPWISFADTHFGYSRVDKYPAVIWQSSTNAIISFEFSRWSVVFCAIVFFLFFGFADEARRNYMKLLGPVITLFRKVVPSKPTHQTFQYVPPLLVFVRLAEHLCRPSKHGVHIQSVGSLPVYYPSRFSPPIEKSAFPPRLDLDFDSVTDDLSPPPTAHTETFHSTHGVAV